MRPKKRGPGRPPIEGGARKWTLRLPEPIYRALTARARATGRPPAAVARAAIAADLARVDLARELRGEVAPTAVAEHAGPALALAARRLEDLRPYLPGWLRQAGARHLLRYASPADLPDLLPALGYAALDPEAADVVASAYAVGVQHLDAILWARGLLRSEPVRVERRRPPLPPPARHEPRDALAEAARLGALRGRIPGWVWRAAARALVDSADAADLDLALVLLGMRALPPAERAEVDGLSTHEQRGGPGLSVSDALDAIGWWSEVA